MRLLGDLFKNEAAEGEWLEDPNDKGLVCTAGDGGVLDEGEANEAVEIDEREGNGNGGDEIEVANMGRKVMKVRLRKKPART